MIDILYVNYNSTHHLKNSIKSFYEINEKINDITISIWDNNSQDNIKEFKKHFPNLKIYLSEINIGFSRAINQLLEKTQAPYIFILNPDTVIDNCFFKEAIDFLNANEDVGLIGPKILNTDGTVQGSARKFPTPLTALFGRNSLLTKIFPKNSITAKNVLTVNNYLTNSFEVDWVSGACMITRRKVLEDVNGFDDKFFLYWEDTDLCKRIRNAGWKIYYYPKIKIFHHVGKSSQFSPYQSIFHFHKSCYYLCKKYTRWPLRILLPFTFFCLTIRALLTVMYHLFLRTFKKK